MSDPHGAEEPQGEGQATTMAGQLHRAVIVLWSLRVLAPLALLWLAGTVQQVIVAVIASLMILASFVRWTRFHWRLSPDALVIEQGLLERRQRVIPLERIQAVQTIRKLQHRAFGVVGLRIEVIGGTQTEGQLDALDPETARRIRERLLQERTVRDGQPSPGPEILARSNFGTLIIAGLTGGRIGVAAALFAFADAFAEQLLDERITSTVLSAPQRLGLAGVLIALLVGALVLFLLSLAATALTYWDFTLARDDSYLLVRRGLLDQRSDTIPLARVQALSIEENVVRRLLGLAVLRVVVAGRAGEDSADTSVLFPLIAKDRAFALVAELLKAPELDGLTLSPMPRGARDRRLVRVALLTIAAAGLGFAILGARGLLAAAVAVIATPAALHAYHALGHARAPNHVVARAGWLVRRTTAVPLVALQTLSVSSSPFQRRRHLATLRLEIARNAGRRDPRIIDLDDDQAHRLLLGLHAEALSRVRSSTAPRIQAADSVGSEHP